MAAFARARTEGADGVELDVLLCRTGEVIVFHDDDLRRLAGRPEPIAHLSLADVRGVTLTRGGGIPTLEEAIEACGPELLVNVELKASGMSAGHIAALVERGGAAPGTYGGRPPDLGVRRSSPRAVGQWMRRSPSIRASLLFEGRTALGAFPATWLHPFGLHPELRLCDPARVSRWRRRGYFLGVWTVDAPADLRACRELGLDAVITNDPGASLAILSAP